MKYLLYISILFHLSFSKAQVYLNDTTLYNSLWCEDIAVYESDSGYYTIGNVLRADNDNNLSLTLGFHHNDGSEELILDNFEATHDQRLFGSIHKLFINDRGNFVCLYKNCESGVGCYLRLKEISPTGVIINDVSYKSILDSLNYGLLDGNNIIQKKLDSSYIIVANVTDESIVNAHSGGGLYLQLDKNFNLIDTIGFFHPTNSRSYTYGELLELENGKILLKFPERLQASNPLEEGRVVFFELDAMGNVLDTSYYSDGQKIGSPYGLERTSDEGYLFNYLKGEWSIEINNWIYYRYFCKVDSSFNLVWKKMTNENEGFGIFWLDKDIEKTLDNNFVTVGGIVDYNSAFDQNSAQIIKFAENGEFLWKRSHYKIPDTSLTYPITIEISNVIATQDSGFCMVGHCRDYFALIEGRPDHYSYLVKTNCLGFIANAEASANYQQKDDYNVTFYNTSMQAGSYYWDFGDGVTLSTDEYTDTVYHSYPSLFNTYEVMLIAYGCYDSLGVRDADTIIFTVTPALHENPDIITEGNGYFAIFPNPVAQGENLYIYLNGLNPDNGDVFLNIYSLDGKHVRKVLLSANEGSYEIVNSLSKGLYNLVLTQNDSILEVEKLVVR